MEESFVNEFPIGPVLPDSLHQNIILKFESAVEFARVICITRT